MELFTSNAIVRNSLRALMLETEPRSASSKQETDSGRLQESNANFADSVVIGIRPKALNVHLLSLAKGEDNITVDRLN